MAHRWSRLTAFGLVLGLAAGAAPLHAGATTPTRLSYLTFSGPVALPGVTLQAGTYAFEIADLNGSSNVVLVRNKARTQAFYMGLTSRVARPANIDRRAAVTLGEGPRGEAKPIVAWYPPQSDDGRAFIYPR